MFMPKVSLFDAFIFAFKSVLDNFRVYFFCALYYMVSMIFIMVGGVGLVLLNPKVIAAINTSGMIKPEQQENFQRVIDFVMTHQWVMVLSAALFVIGLILLFAVIAGVIKVFFNLYARREVSLADFFEGTKRALPLFMLSILVGLCVMVGFILFIIPGIYLAIRLAFAKFIIVNENIGVVDALKKSWYVSKGQYWNIVGLYTLVFLIASMHTNAAIIFIPLFIGSAVYLYKKATETTAA